MLKIPEHHWERILTEELEYRQATDTKMMKMMKKPKHIANKELHPQI